MTLDLARLTAVVRTELATLRASTARELVPNGPARALGIGTPFALPYSAGRSWIVPVILEPGTLRVPTELGLRFSASLEPAGTISITARPLRTDLVTATALALGGESKAFAAATAALDAAHVARPTTEWAAALHAIALDPRLSAAERVGMPSWSLMFEPYDETNGGWTFVLIDATTFAVQKLQGRPVPP